MADFYKNFIGGKWTETSGKQRLVNRNPADTDDVIGEYPSATREDTKAAIDAAKAAFPAWRATPAPERGRIMAKAAQLALSRKEELARNMTREEGKIYKEALGEILKGVNLMEFYSGEGFRMGGFTRPSEMRSTFTYTI